MRQRDESALNRNFLVLRRETTATFIEKEDALGVLGKGVSGDCDGDEEYRRTPRRMGPVHVIIVFWRAWTRPCDG